MRKTWHVIINMIFTATYIIILQTRV
jgi:hypothetical protein